MGTITHRGGSSTPPRQMLEARGRGLPQMRKQPVMEKYVVAHIVKALKEREVYEESAAGGSAGGG